MKLRLRSVIVAVLGIVVVAGTAGAAGGQATPPRDGSQNVAVADPRTRFVPGELLVRFRDGVGDEQRVQALRANGAERKRRLRVPGLELVRLGPGRSVEATARALANRPEVAYAEPNWIYRAAATPNDPRFNQLWGLNQASDADIDAPEAWNTTTGSANVTVAVVDTGVAYLHTDLAPNIWANPGETGGGKEANGVDDDTNGFIDDHRGWDTFDNDKDPADTDGHGTHVAGTIGARGNDAFGVPGVNWTVKIMPVRVLGPGGGTNETVTEGFAYAADNGAKVVNASLGCDGCFSQAMKDVIDARPNTLYVIAAGNSAANNDSTPHYPCAYTSANLLCVAATDSNDALASFSNYGATSVDLAAPGVGILSTWPGSSTVFSEGFEGGFGNWTTGGASNNTWNRTSEAAATGSWSATDSPGALYLANTDSWMQKGTALSLAGQSNCALAYDLRLDVGTIDDLDTLWIEASTTGAPDSWDFVDLWWGSSDGAFFSWESDMSFLDGSPSVYFRFRLETDNAAPLQAQGAHLDNIAVRCSGTGGGVNDYNTISGTSMATPHVAGVAALLWAANPLATRAQVQSALLNGVDAKASLSGKVLTGGRLNAANSIGLIGTTALCFGSPATITGTGAGETLTGTPGNDVIAGLGGDDTLVGGGGDDKLCGGDGADTVDFSSSATGVVASLGAGSATGQGSDQLDAIERLTGSPLNDTLNGDAGVNVLNGANGNDILRGGPNDDTLNGGAGTGDRGDYALSSTGVTASLTTNTATGEGNDLFTGLENLTGSNQVDTLTGNGGVNQLVGFGGNDTLNGEGGADLLLGRLGDDQINGGLGADTADFSQSPAGVTATMTGATGEGTDTFTGIENLAGSPFDDSLTGDSGINALVGAGGNDTLTGGANADTLRGRGGNDALNGGDGSDVGDFTQSTTAVDANLTTNTATGEGNDTFSSVENLGGSPFNDTLTGGPTANILSGNGGNDGLNGMDGNDNLRGGQGNDVYTGGTGTDVADYSLATAGIVANLNTTLATGEGTDTINAGVEWLFGSNHADDLTGSGVSNRIEGRNGNDTIKGLGLNDVLIGGLGTDNIDGGDGAADNCDAESESNCEV